MKLTLTEIKKSYSVIKQLAFEEYRNGNLEGSLEFIDHATVLAQQFNWIYSDAELENFLQCLSKKIINDNERKFSPVKNRVVFFDDFCTSFVLAIQYLNALVAADKEILYITGRDIYADTKFVHIIDIIKNYPKLSVKIIPLKGQSRESRIKYIYQAIVDFGPSKLLLHINANSICVPALYALPKKITRYLINLADQTFWLGSSGIDYSLEFREFGASVSLQRRGLSQKQLLLIPFYPVADSNPFQGFPKECSRPGQVNIFSGGDYYKTIDKEKIYWKLVKKIMDNHPEVLFLFATKRNPYGNEKIQQFVTENNYEGRFFYIGFRPDINEVFMHCDIFMGTCPASGSLMSQLAAANAKPILQYYMPNTPDDETEAAICYNRKLSISYYDEKGFLTEAAKLVTDRVYRIKKGQELQQAMITVDQFDLLVKNTLETNQKQLPISPFEVNYQLLDERWYSIENEGFIDTTSYVYSIIGNSKCRQKIPNIYIKYHYNRFFKNKLFNKNWYRKKLLNSK